MNRQLLAFALVGVPSRAARPLARVLDGRGLLQLNAGEAAFLIEGIVYLQWIKSGLVGLVGGGLIAIVNETQAQPRGLLLWPPLALMLWLPAYMITLAVLRIALRRGDRTRAFEFLGWAVTSFRLAPAIGLVVGALVAALI